MKIKSLKLLTKNIRAQKAFYIHQLGAELIDENKTSFQIRVGRTELTFCQSENAHPYHAAFNVPSNHSRLLVPWLKKKNIAVQPLHNEELVDFRNWNAHSVYFYDADQNIMEFIARHDLASSSSSVFDAAQWLSVSEIGMPVRRIEQCASQLSREIGFPVYDAVGDSFLALGDPEGLLIVIDSEKKHWLPNGDAALPADFSAIIEQNGKSFQLDFRNGTLHTDAM
ncbi:MAG: VOC family protein [Cytophagales bacterium]|nr:VOC family protein [Cytophagales bacterium]